MSKEQSTHTHTHTRVHTHAGSVWECIRVSEGYCFIRANFIQLLSDSTPREQHIQAHTYASPPGLGEIIVYLYKCSGKKKNPTLFALFLNQQAILIWSRLPGGRWSPSRTVAVQRVPVSVVRIPILKSLSLCF